jgi:hypothetical protein
VKYYIYISDAKVDMLLPQITDAQKKKISSEFGFDFKILHAKRTTESTTNDDRIARLETVVSFIREFGNLGTIEEPDEYIEDSAAMYSAMFGDSQGMAYFTARVNKTAIGLGGSATHLIGTRVDGVTSHFNSLSSFILEALEDSTQSNTLLGLECVRRLLEDYIQSNKPTENLRFMAKRLLSQSPEEPTGQIILGTPLYVTKED